MPESQPHITTANGGRQFACSPAAVLVFIVNEREELLLLSHPLRGGMWEVVNGALEAGETVLAGALRETAEEAGPDVRVRPLGTVHTMTFHYDSAVQYMLSLSYLAAYEGGEVVPGDDMAGSQVGWFGLDELLGGDLPLFEPLQQSWLLERVIELYRLWKDTPLTGAELQPPLNPDPHPKRK